MILFYESYFNDSDPKKSFLQKKRAKIQVQVIHCNQHSCIKGTNIKNTQKQAI